MHWIIFHIKHTAAYLCSITHLAVWTMRKDFHVILFPYLQNCNHVQILEHGWVWLLVPLKGCGYHRNGEEKLKVVEELWVISSKTFI